MATLDGAHDARVPVAVAQSGANHASDAVAISSAVPLPLPSPSRRDLNLGPFLSTLGDEMLMVLLEYLDIPELLCAGTVSPVMYLLCNEEALWRQHCHRIHGFDFEFFGSWKATTLGKRELQGKTGIVVSGFSSDFLYRRWFRNHVDLSSFLPPLGEDGAYVERRRFGTISRKEFERSYEFPRRLLMLTGLDNVRGWPCYSEKRWTPERFVERFSRIKPGKKRSVRFDISHTVDKKKFSHASEDSESDDEDEDYDCDDACDADAIEEERKRRRAAFRSEMTMKRYVDYCKMQSDETPHYVFEPHFGEKAPSLLREYSRKSLQLFPEDYLSALGKRTRPNFRWIVMGPARSGAPWHLDPTYTSAWNALLVGRKRWAFYPPGTVPPGVSVDWGDEDEGGASSGEADPRRDGCMPDDIETPSSLQWYLEVYPTLSKEQRPIEIIQNPGDVIFVPCGWWHMVLNLDMTLAVTQNYAGRHNLCRVLDDVLATEGPRALVSTKTKMERKYPLLRRTLALYMLPFEEGYTSEVERLQGFRDKSMWGPLAEKVLAAHGLETSLVEEAQNRPADSACSCCGRAHDRFAHIVPMSVRANPIFAAGSTVIKLFSHYHSGEFQRYSAEPDNAMLRGGGELTFQVELTMCLAIKSLGKQTQQRLLPGFLGHGQLYASSETWRFPYVLLQRVQGAESFASVRRFMLALDESGDERRAAFMSSFACWLARSVRTLHDQVDASLLEKAIKEHKFAGAHSEFDASSFPLTSSWTWYLAFLDSQIASCMGTLWRWYAHIGLRKDVLARLSAYLCQSPRELVAPALLESMPKTLHGDLQPENVLGTFEGVVDARPSTFSADQLRAWHPCTLIDYGDAKSGDPLYDLVAVHVATFQCDRRMLRAFMEAYGSEDERQRVGFDCTDAFLRRAMSLTVLHPCNALRSVFRHMPGAAAIETWEELARALWAWWE